MGNLRPLTEKELDDMARRAALGCVPQWDSDDPPTDTEKAAIMARVRELVRPRRGQCAQYGDILSRREVERILAGSFDESDDVRALARHDAALRAECDELQALAAAVETMPVLGCLMRRQKAWVYLGVHRNSLGATPWEALKRGQEAAR